MSGATDSGMVKTMGIVMGALLLLAIVCAVAARILSAGSEDPNDSMMRNMLVQRIQPVASVRTSADDLPAASQSVASAADIPQTPEELVNGACAACHVAGVADAPKLDDEAAWAERRAAGLDALVASVINGKGSMPARGGSTYSDEEILKAVQHIALFDVEEEAAAPADQSEESASTETSTEESTNSQASTASEEASASTAASALVVGAVPDGLTDNIKAQVDGICASCHLAGVANAPKYGDRDAWQLRADKGLEALTSSVINGLNVMPARGASTLTDEEIPVAIQYMMSK